MANEYERLIVSVWLPLGINNLRILSEKIKNHLKTNQKKLRFTSWDGRVQLKDHYLSFVLRFNSRYEKLTPAILVLEAYYYGWGYIEYSLTLENHQGIKKTLTPNFVNENMHSLLEKTVDIVGGTLLEHQQNYLSNVLFGNGVLSIETYLEAAKNNQLKNGIMDGASDEEIRQGFRFEVNQLEAITATEISSRRDNDILVKTCLLNRSDSLQAPVAYDDIDGDFGAFTENYPKQYLKGRHRSSLIILKSGLDFNQNITKLVCSTNSIIRFLRLLINVMVTTRKQLSLLSQALLQRRGIKFGNEISKLVSEAQQEHLQGYAYYLISRIPLLEEVGLSAKEAQEKVSAWLHSISPNIDSEMQEELLQSTEYMDELVYTAKRIIDGLKDEIKSVRDLIGIYDEEEAYSVSTRIEAILNAIREIQDSIQKSSYSQAAMQKRSLESQFIQSELARSSELRQRTGRTITQLTGAIAIAGLLSTALKSPIDSILALAQFSSAAVNVTNATFPLALGLLGWFVVGNFLSQSKRYGDIVEVTIPLRNQIFGEKELIEKRFRDDERKISEKHLNRFRVEGNTHRVTWEDEISGSSNKVFATIEYARILGNTHLTSLMMSAEKSEDEKSILDLKEKIIQLAAARLLAICNKDEEGKQLSLAYWQEQIEQAQASN